MKKITRGGALKGKESFYNKKGVILAVAAILLVSGFFVVNNALAAATVTPASGGTGISIDTTSAGGSPSFKLLSGPTITEFVAGDISAGIHTITLPSGWKFDTSQVVKVNGGAFTPTTQDAVITENTLSFTITEVSGSPGVLSFISDLSGNSIKVMPTGTVSGSTGYMTHSGASIAGVTDGVTSFGTLTTVPGVPTQLKIENSATGGQEIDTATVPSGTTLTAYANTRDQFGNFATNVAATWSLTGSTGGVGGPDLVPAGDNKSAVFTGRLVGTTVIQTVGGSFTDITGIITVVPGAVSATNSTIGVNPNSAVVSSGANPITVTVTAKDTAGNLISGKTVSIAAIGTTDNTINPASASTDSNGVATFTISSTKAEQKTISATIEGNPIDALQNKTVTFTHGVASRLEMKTQPSTTATAGDVFGTQPAINIVDQFGNLVDNDNATVITAVRNSTAGGSQTLFGNLTAMALAGVATFTNLSYQEATTIKIDFTSGSLEPITSDSITITPAAPANAEFTTQPSANPGSTVDNALSVQPVARVTDQYGNNVANGITVTLSVTPATGAGTLQGTLTALTNGGTATFSGIGYNKTDAFSITATAGSASVASNSVGPLNAGIINNFSISAISPQIAGAPFDVTVSGAVDQFGNLASGTVTISAFSGGGNSPSGATPTYGAITVTAGIGSANSTLVNAVSTVLRGTVGTITADTSPITVSANTQTQITLTSDINDIDANGIETAMLTAQLKDTYGNNKPVAGVSIAFTSPRGTIVTSPVLTDGNGQAVTTFNSGADRNSGNVVVTASSGVLTSGTKTIAFNDVTPPNAPGISIPPTSPVIINIANKSTQVLSGTAEAGSTVKIWVDGIATSVTKTATGDGAFAFTNAELQTAGIVSGTDYSVAKVVTVKATDAATNESVASNSISYTQDTLAPSVSSYTLNGSGQNVVFNPGSVTIALNANEPVTWTSLQIKKTDNASIYKTYTISSSYNGTASAIQAWDGTLTAGTLVDGEYLIEMHIKDSANNDVDNLVLSPYRITVDRLAPTVALTYSANPAKAGAMTVTATYDEPVVGTPQISIDQQGSTDISNQNMTVTASTDNKIWTYSYMINVAVGITYIDGEATVGLSAVADAAGNPADAPANTTFTIDTTPPTATITLPTTDTVVKNTSGNVSLEFVSTGGSVCEYKVGTEGTYQSLADCASPRTITLTDGRKLVVLKVTDAAGNFTESAAVSFVVDTNNALTVGSDADFTTIQAAIDAATSGDTINVAAGTYAESVTINKSLTVQKEASALTKPVIQVNDGWGFKLLGAANITIDGFEIQVTGGSSTNDQAIRLENANGAIIKNNTITTTADTALGIWTCGTESGCTNSDNVSINDNNITISGVATGIYAEQVNGAHTGWSITGNTIIANAGVPLELYDVTVSTVSGNILDGSTTNSNTIWSSQRANISNLTFTNNTVNDSSGSMVAFLSDFLLLGDGLDNTTASVVNISENTFNGWGSRGLRIGDGVTGATVNNNKFLGTGQALKNEDASQVNAEANWWGTTDGATIAAAISGSVDFRPWRTSADLTQAVDTTSPTITVNSLLTNDTTPTITGTVNESSVVKINVSGADYAATVSGNTWSANVTVVLAAGTYNVTATAEDLAGNIGIDATSNELTIDTTAPTVTLTKDHADTIVRDADTVVVTATFNEAMTAPTISIGTLVSGAAMTNVSGNIWTYSWDVLAGNDGAVVAAVVGTDLAGNPYAGTDSISFTIDNIAPVVAITQPAAGSTVNAAKVITFTDNGTAPQCSIDNSVWVACVSGTTTLGGVTGFGALADGSLTLYLRDIDAAGNPGTTQVTIVKDTTAPSILGKTPSANAVGVAPSTNITVTFNEDVVITGANVIITNNPAKTVTFDSVTKIATIDPTNNLANNTTHTITLTGVTDTIGNVLPDISWSFTTSASYSIALTTGWNLISLPVVPTNTSASAVLGALDNATKIQTVWKYNPVAGEWGAYHPGVDILLSDFSDMTAGEGYWIDYLASDAGTIAGTGNLFQEGNSTPPQKTLAAGWNLIGYYQLENVINTTATKALSSVAGQWTQLRTYSNTAKQFQSVVGSGYMKPGEGYWIFMKSSSYAPYLYGPGDADL